MSNVSIRVVDHPWKRAWHESRDPCHARVTWSILELYTDLNFSGVAEDRIVKFCARVGPRSISLIVTNYPQVGVVNITRDLNCLANKCQYLENGARQRYTYNRRLIGNRIWPIKWQQRQWPWITVKVIHRLQAFSNAILWTFVQHLHDFNWQCACGPFALAELLVWIGRIQTRE